MTTPSFYAVIPATVRYCKQLEPNAKLLYGEITALTQREGFCWASNAYFAELYEVDERSIRNWLTSLKDLGFIEIELTKEGIKTIRKIWISGEVKKMFTKGKNFPPGRKKISGGAEKIFRHINTGITTKEKTVCNPEAGCSKQEEKKMEKERLLKEAKAFSDLPTEITKDHASGGEVKVVLNDVFLASVKTKKDWKTSEIQQAWKILIDYSGPIRDPMRFIEGTIANLRNLKKAEFLNQRVSEPCKATNNQTSNNSKQSSSDNDTEERVYLGPLLEDLERRMALKKSSNGLNGERASWFS